MGAREELLRERLSGLGFDEVRIASLGGEKCESGLAAWLAAGRQADMAWMERSAAKRLDPQLVLAGARSIIMLGVAYSADGPQRSGPTSAEGAGRGRWARYALHEDYHDTIKPALVAAGKAIEELWGVSGEDYRYYVDTGPVLERGWAARAGLGFIGKNAMLISPTRGNWLLLAAILVRVELTPDAPLQRLARGAGDAPGDVGLRCGKCTRCLDACPTQALTAPGELDARRCISYQTIENKGVIPRELRSGIGRRVYGCDVCAEVCPWNRFARQGKALLLVARRELAGLTLRELLELTPERFAEVFRRTPVKRVKLAGMLRNACVAAGNSGDRALLAPLVRLAGHASALVRAHAVWAVCRLTTGSEAASLLAETRRREGDAVVLAEYAAESPTFT